jgi:hypothetical protein
MICRIKSSSKVSVVGSSVIKCRIDPRDCVGESISTPQRHKLGVIFLPKTDDLMGAVEVQYVE